LNCIYFSSLYQKNKKMIKRGNEGFFYFLFSHISTLDEKNKAADLA